MRKIKTAIIILFGIAYLFGCKGRNINAMEGEKMSQKRENFATVEYFKTYYGITDTDISDEVIENFIFEYSVTSEKIENQDELALLKSIIDSGDSDRLGYYLPSIYGAKWIAQKPIEEFVYDANWIYMEFQYPNPRRDEFTGINENMLIDLKHKKMYFGCDVGDYRNAKLCAELSDEDIKQIREEFPKCFVEENENIECGYGYDVYVVDGNKNKWGLGKEISENYNQLFDRYWKELYSSKFGNSYK